MDDIYLAATIGGRRFDGVANGNAFISRDGLDGWWDSPETATEETLIAGADGAEIPSAINVLPRRVNFSGWFDSSSPEWAEEDVRSWAAGLVRRTDVGFGVFHGGRWKYLHNASIRGKVRVVPNRQDMRKTMFECTVWAPDPWKYGRETQVLLSASTPTTGGMEFPIVDSTIEFTEGSNVPDVPGYFNIRNPGTAPLYPWFEATGRQDGFTIVSEGRTLQYEGTIAAGQMLTVSPYAGGRAILDGADVSELLVRAEWAPVEGGQTRGYFWEPSSPSASASLRIKYYEGAWA